MLRGCSTEAQIEPELNKLTDSNPLLDSELQWEHSRTRVFERDVAVRRSKPF